MWNRLKFSDNKFVRSFMYVLKRYFGSFQRTDLILLITRYPMIVSPNLGNPAFVIVGKNQEFEMTIACIKQHKQAYIEKILKNHIVLRNSRTLEEYTGKVFDIQPHPVNKYSYLHNLARRNVFGLRNQFFTVKIRVPRIKIPPPRKFELFDITYYNPNRNPHTVYHALCVTSQDWVNFSFLQLTDLHIAKRNDVIFDTIGGKRFAAVDLDLPIEDFFESMDPEIFTNPKLRDIVEFLEFRNRANNFNIALRQVITHANALAAEGNLDFVLMTGDLVDFVHISDMPLPLSTERSNFQTLFEILIGKFQSQPLLVPFFTVPGNHDFRLNHYMLLGVTALNLAAEYKSFGLTRREAELYKSVRSFNPLSTSSNALVDYHRLFNPKLDFFKQFGKFHFLFYNTGPDVFFGGSAFVDLIGGEPGTYGLDKVQMRWFREYVEKAVEPDDKVCVVFHTPAINFDRENDIQDMLAPTRVQRGATPWISDHRVDVGTIHQNRVEFILAAMGLQLPRPIDLVITGHVHRPSEYRVEPSGIENAERPEDSYHVYCDYYSKQLEDLGGDLGRVRSFWEANRPIFVNSCALGPINTHVREGRVPAHRHFVVKDGEIISFSQHFRHTDPYIFLSQHRNVILEVPWKSALHKNWQDFRGKADVEIYNPEGITQSFTYFEVEFHFRGRGVKGFDLKPHLHVKTRFKKGKMLQSPELEQTKNHYRRIYVIENAQRFQWSFAGRCAYGGGLFSGLTGIRMTVRVISVVRKGEWRVIGDEETANKVGLSY